VIWARPITTVSIGSQSRPRQLRPNRSCHLTLALPTDHASCWSDAVTSPPRAAHAAAIPCALSVAAVRQRLKLSSPLCSLYHRSALLCASLRLLWLPPMRRTATLVCPSYRSGRCHRRCPRGLRPRATLRRAAVRFCHEGVTSTSLLRPRNCPTGSSTSITPTRISSTNH
jgi:hypothetical protein